MGSERRSKKTNPSSLSLAHNSRIVIIIKRKYRKKQSIYGKSSIVHGMVLKNTHLLYYMTSKISNGLRVEGTVRFPVKKERRSQNEHVSFAILDFPARTPQSA